MWGKLKALLRDEEGQALSEYGLVIALIAIGAIAALIALKDQLIAVFTKLKDSLKVS